MSIVKDTDRITLLIKKSRKKQFIEMLKLFDFVQVESQEERLRNLIKNAPKNVPITDEEIMAEVKAVRRARK